MNSLAAVLQLILSLLLSIQNNPNVSQDQANQAITAASQGIQMVSQTLTATTGTQTSANHGTPIHAVVGVPPQCGVNAMCVPLAPGVTSTLHDVIPPPPPMPSTTSSSVPNLIMPGKPIPPGPCPANAMCVPLLPGVTTTVSGDHIVVGTIPLPPTCTANNTSTCLTTQTSTIPVSSYPSGFHACPPGVMCPL